MDKNKKRRGGLRASFTKTLNALKAELEKDEIDKGIIKDAATKLDNVMNEIIEFDQKIIELIADDENSTEESIFAEMEENEKYSDEFITIKRLVTEVLNDVKPVVERVVPNESISSDSKHRHYKYPKLNIKPFDGSLINYLSFWAQFKKIHEDAELDDCDKFQYLLQSVQPNTRAKELLESYPITSDNYPKAVLAFQDRFGNKDLLVEVYVREFLKLIIVNVQSNSKDRLLLTDLFTKVDANLRSLESLGLDSQNNSAWLYPMVESSLPEEILKAWQRYSLLGGSQSEDTPKKSNLELLMNFLRHEVEGEERIILASENFRIENKNNFKSFKEKKVGNNKHKYGDNRQVASAADLLTSSEEHRQCIFCNNLHNSTDCLKVRKMTMEDRKNLVEQSGSCFLCLKPGHQVRKCYSKVTCLGCGKRHHILLCHNMKQQAFSPTGKETAELDDAPNKDQALANVSRSPNVMLQTLTVLIRGNGRKRKARAIIDTASQRSYILKTTAKEMKYKRDSCEYLQHSLFGGENTGVCKHDVFTLYLTSCDGSYNCHFKVLSQPVICESTPPTLPAIQLKELTDYSISINDDYQGPIEILIGADVAGKIITGGYKSLSCGLTAMETRLGWTVMGRIPQISSEESEISLVNSMLSTTRTITELWTLDTLGITDPSETKTKEDIQESAREPFINTVQVDKDNRFVVHLPWLDDHPPLPDNFNLALNRLDNTARKLNEENLYDDYNQVFEEWAGEGIIEEVPKHEIQLPSHYLPHRHVVKENSTTRIRPVFDASAKQRGSPSLNDCLEKGVNLVELIPTILTRFRMNKFGVTADIRKAFLQIRLQENDKDYLRFLWYNENKELKYLRHCRVVFGVSSSPFLLNSVIQYHLETILDEIQHGNSKYPVDVVQKFKNSFYVDNCLASLKTETELHEFIQVATDIMAERKFDLRGWEHNCSHFSTEEVSCENNKIVQVLGLQWFLNSDVLSVNLKEVCEDDGPVTKRKILPEVHKIFDPIGYTCPVTLYPKLMLQELWKMKTTWDAELTPAISKKFEKWRKQLNLLKEIAIPRCLTRSLPP